MKQRLIEIIKKALTEQPKKKKCDCGCDECMGSPMLNESKQYVMPISENMRYHLDKKIPIHDNTFRPGSKAHIDLIHETRLLWKKGVIELQDEDKKLFENTDLGRFGVYEGEVVPLDLPLMEIEIEPKFNINKVWDFIESRPFYNKSYMPMFNTAEEIWSEWGPKEKELYNSFEWKDTYGGEIHPREKMALKKRQTYKNLTETQMLDGYEVDFFRTKANVYANIEIPSENPTFEDNIQIKGTGKNEEEAFKDLQQNYKNYKKTRINEAELGDIITINPESFPNFEFPYGTEGKIVDISKADYASDDLVYTVKLKYIDSQGDEQNILDIEKSNQYLNEAEKKKQPALGKPKRGGSKKFYVYVKDPKTKRIKKVSFGMAGGGLRAKLNNSKARSAFSKRHNCPQKKDRTKASYWSCRLPRYAKLLGFKTTFSGYW
jgi:hypothetical protein